MTLSKSRRVTPSSYSRAPGRCRAKRLASCRQVHRRSISGAKGRDQRPGLRNCFHALTVVAHLVGNDPQHGDLASGKVTSKCRRDRPTACSLWLCVHRYRNMEKGCGVFCNIQPTPRRCDNRIVGRQGVLTRCRIRSRGAPMRTTPREPMAVLPVCGLPAREGNNAHLATDWPRDWPQRGAGYEGRGPFVRRAR